MVSTIVQLGTAAVATAVLEKICLSLNRQDLAEWVRVGGTSSIGVVAVNGIFKLIKIFG